MQPVTYQPIGVVESPFEAPEDVPRPGAEQVEASGRILLDESYEPGLQGLAAFSHIVVLAHLHEVTDTRLTVRPMGGDPVGIFATSGPPRPNPIGQSVLRLDGIEGTRLSVSNLDLIDGTPVLDIKPYAPKGPGIDEIEIGWMADL
ncbi:tRNA (N6-threonylcarbamoyladenosine(37)-N6)-methyltransferase TrmO [Halodesulfurarchaeum sp. HSR-GB]|uniref:tRNA (N6-threonylcarbamoyladenosine(37)-N6)-methyltransferase TrmO n=1 Tax=Halodesulfurarchaeum sp. HSR-GB TaxID=3074077 RepID=UPI00285D00CC|nr:tRNA (N6-threonylcarbamoyladenosine(37)-N6)-methyltransferase TrmO [Halodesulfurarchaeum sp. HSR-GB]MDR5656531.1 tRNA (N6-threonylcarbamoyladenosine(37)-N6)-methyltransferase TrmO [Halodesulfurarchaeum sp. HSR-GB]